MSELTPQAYKHMKHPHGIGGLDIASACGRAGVEGQGPFFAIFLQASKSKIIAAGFRTHACPWANAIGSVVAQSVEGCSLEKTDELSSEVIIAKLGAVPRSKRELVELALSALKDASRKGAVIVEQQPWASEQVVAR